MEISRFHYLTQDLENITHMDLVKQACESGIKWIQLRVKNKTKNEILEIAKVAREITNKHKVTLIINDHVDIAKAILADGVHLGLEDFPVDKAREILGNDSIIGGTANTFDDVRKQYNLGCNYIGLGPFRFTNTKEELKPILSDRIADIIKKSKLEFPKLPIIVIGGIVSSDVNKLMSLGAYGLAVSSAINLSPNFKQEVECFLNKMES